LPRNLRVKKVAPRAPEVPDIPYLTRKSCVTPAAIGARARPILRQNRARPILRQN
jgi:hypothetical protein